LIRRLRWFLENGIETMVEGSPFDVVVIGGSFAGLSAAMQIARARRSVLVIDSGKPRNRFASHSHGFLGQDGKTPEEILTVAREQLSAYPTASFMHETVASATGEKDAFELTRTSGTVIKAKRLIIAVGVSDQLPDLPGLKEKWGDGVLHCPYCHGYEIAGNRLGVFATSNIAAHQAHVVRDWGRVTVFLRDGFSFDADAQSELEKMDVPVESVPLAGIEGEGRSISHVVLKDGRRVALDALFVAPQTEMSSPIAKQLGCETTPGPLGDFITVDDWQATSVRGVYAAGDAATGWTNATIASAAGVQAGVAAHQSLIGQF
jgi:thioredoxin reductase